MGAFRLTNEFLGLKTGDDARRNYRSHADASVCCRCGDPIPPGTPVWMLSCRLFSFPFADSPIPANRDFAFVENTVAAWCKSCASSRPVSPRGKNPQQQPVMSGPCRGCGREVHLYETDENCGKSRARAFLCSQRCRNKVYGARFRKRHGKPKPAGPLARCTVCQRNFPAKRSDAKTCSPACRQKAYRRKVTVTDNGKGDIR